MKKTFEIKGVDLTELYGIGDQNILFLEKSLPLNINIRGNSLFCKGLKKDLDHFSVILGHMVDSIKKGNNLTTKDINQLLAMNMQKTLDKKKSINDVIFYGKKGPIHARSDGQKKLFNSLHKNDIVISVGPAGTGKTFLAVAYALSLLEKHEIEKIIFCRPAVEAGESLGFLPGDLKEKVDPYLAPLYDSLKILYAENKLVQLLERKIIEVVPLAYMRGRTLDSAYMILDEAQNASVLQMKMFLTRLGIGSRAIITGDVTQIDLQNRSDSGLLQASELLKGVQGIGIVKLDKKDVVRHPLVMKIIEAYDQN